MTALAPASPVWNAVSRRCKVLQVKSPKTKLPLLATLTRRTVVIPLMEDHIAQRPVQYAALAPTPEALETLGDKARFADYVRRQGLENGCPATYESIDEAEFPCVIKRTNLNTGMGIEVVSSREEAMGLVAAPPFAGHRWIIQEKVFFQVEYVVHCVCVDGRIVWHVVYAYDAQRLEMRGTGRALKLRAATIPAHLLAKLEAFLAPLNYSGPCNCDCTWDDEERLMVFEINPRLGGSLMLPRHAADLAACLSVIIEHASVSCPSRRVEAHGMDATVPALAQVERVERETALSR
ncbi:hypothetical protein [Rariglobus hedericola]|uniref:ATP-grasp domain-containing protein n=1 Tax=Rariglobus hedericola TaxID=2597822 RepID=A0A556QK47_9BACT|nr:hypothetical protein [Rariglobus hedericola]TSJ77025.1 hypothetical protein FPL22_13015 [Rariglobus hedericola]